MSRGCAMPCCMRAHGFKPGDKCDGQIVTYREGKPLCWVHFTSIEKGIRSLDETRNVSAEERPTLQCASSAGKVVVA